MPASIFSRISTKLAMLSAIGILLVAVMLLTVWQGGQHVAQRAKYRDEQLIVSRDLVDAKALRGLQVGVRDLRLATSTDEIAKAADYIAARHHSVIKYLDDAMEGLRLQVNRDRIVKLKALGDRLYAATDDMAEIVKAKLALKAGDPSLNAKEKDVQVKLLAISDETAQLIDEGVDAAKAMATKAEEEADAGALLVLSLNLGIGLLTIATLIGAAVFGARVIAKPIGRITASMSKLAEGNLAAEIPFANRRDEIGQMARAVEIFKQNGIKVRELDAAGADKRAKVIEMQMNIDAVITAAVAGDFTRRAVVEYGYQDLNQFASGVNDLVAAVQPRNRRDLSRGCCARRRRPDREHEGRIPGRLWRAQGKRQRDDGQPALRSRRGARRCRHHQRRRRRNADCLWRSVETHRAAGGVAGGNLLCPGGDHRRSEELDRAGTGSQPHGG